MVKKLTAVPFLLSILMIGLCDKLWAQSRIVYEEGFESISNSWTSQGTNSSWMMGNPSGVYINNAATGARAAVTNLSGAYNDKEYSFFHSPFFDFSNYDLDPTFEFSHTYNLDSCCDASWLEISLDSGKNWTKLGYTNNDLNWYNDSLIRVWSGNDASGSGSWQRARAILANSAGKKHVGLRFVMKSDSTIQKEGVGIDDIAILLSANEIFQDTLSFCGDTSRMLNAHLLSGSSYLWSTSDTTTEIEIKNTGTYWVQITDTISGRVIADTVEVIQSMDIEPATFARAIDTICLFDRPIVIELEPLLSQFYKYTWEFNMATTHYSFLIVDPNALSPGMHNVKVTVENNVGCSSEGTHSIFADFCGGINELEKSVVQIFPNPAKEKLDIQLDGKIPLGSIVLYIIDVQGGIIKGYQLNDLSGQLNTTIDLTTLPRGIYLLKMESKSGVYTEQVIKQ